MRRSMFTLGALALVSLALAGCEPEEREFRPPSSAPTSSSSGGQSSAADTADSGVVSEVELSESIIRGRAQFTRVCTPCHGQNAQGVIGPNLTDGASIHEANSAEDYRDVIANGVPARGMPAWRALLNDDGVDHVLRYIWSIRHSNVQGRAAQGSYRLPPL